MTQIVEVPIYATALRHVRPRTGLAQIQMLVVRARGSGDSSNDTRKDTSSEAGSAQTGLAARAAIGFVASLITHPIVWFVIPRIPHDSYA